MSNEGTLLADYEPSTSTKILPSFTSYFARSSASASESTLIAACGWRALTARMALPLSAMATKHHSCSGEPPPGFGSTVTIFHPVVMAEGYPSPSVPPESQHAKAQLSLPYRACQGEANGAQCFCAAKVLSRPCLTWIKGGPARIRMSGLRTTSGPSRGFAVSLRSAMCGRLRVGKSFLHVCSIGRCSHVFGL